MDERAVLDMARLIRPHLTRLLGSDAGEVDDELGHLLSRSERGQTVEADVLRVIGRHDATREWAHRLVEGAAGEDVFEPMPDSMLPIPVPRYVCPRIAECGTDFYRFSAGERVPPCGVHGLALVADKS